jgi:hypothetical protein
MHELTWVVPRSTVEIQDETIVVRHDDEERIFETIDESRQRFWNCVARRALLLSIVDVAMVGDGDD